MIAAHNRSSRQRGFPGLAVLGFALCLALAPGLVVAQAGASPAPGASGAQNQSGALSDSEWRQVDQAVARALAWLASKQQSDGSFESIDLGQPAVTALCLMAYLSSGHLPGEGTYGQQIQKTIDYLLECQISGGDCDGLISLKPPRPDNTALNSYYTCMYNHAIAGVALCESYGMTRGEQNRRIDSAIRGAIAVTLRAQNSPKPAYAEGGWRYGPETNDADLSITSWQLMFLRAARNAGYDVPMRSIERAMGFVHRCYVNTGAFSYSAVADSVTPAMSGAGILALALGGEHASRQASSAAQWIAQRAPELFGTYNSAARYHYNLYHCALGLFQLGGKPWEDVYPAAVRVLLSGQAADGSWPPEVGPPDELFGSTYTTALAVQILMVPAQLVPIYQR